MSETPFEPFTTDSYFEQYDKPTVFVVQGQAIIVASERLADALCRLPEQRRIVLLMYFFLGYTDKKIGNVYGRSELLEVGGIEAVKKGMGENRA